MILKKHFESHTPLENLIKVMTFFVFFPQKSDPTHTHSQKFAYYFRWSCVPYGLPLDLLEVHELQVKNLDSYTPNVNHLHDIVYATKNTFAQKKE